MQEKWKRIKGYEDAYEISSIGRIKSIDRLRKFGRSNVIKKGTFLQPQLDKNGYLKVVLHKNNQPKTYSIHRLVACNFIENKYNLPFVNHKDENKLNNNVDNLEWCDRKYNNNYGTRTLRASKKCRKQICQYDLEGNFIKKYDSVYQAKIENSKSSGTHISEVCNGKRKTAYGYVWKYYFE